MNKSILLGLSDCYGKIKADNNLLKRLDKFIKNYIYSNDVHINFMSSNTFGDTRLYFTVNDTKTFINTVMLEDDKHVKHILQNIDGIVKEYSKISNIVDMTCCYLMHLFIHSNLPEKNRTEGIILAYKIFAFRNLSSTINSYLKFDTPKELALALVEKMSNKFILKREGNWEKVIEYRTRDALPKGPYYDSLDRFSNDDYYRAVQGMHDRLKDMIKELYEKLVQVNEANEGIATRKTTSSNENGEEVLISISNDVLAVKQAILRSLSNPIEFNNPILAGIVSKKFNILNKQTCLLAVEKFTTYDIKNIEELIPDFVSNVFTYLVCNNVKNDYKRRILEVVNYVKAYVNMYDFNSPELTDIREAMKELVRQEYKGVDRTKRSNIAYYLLTYIFCKGIYST